MVVLKIPNNGNVFPLWCSEHLSLKCWDLFLDSTSICVPLSCLIFPCLVCSVPQTKDVSPGAGWSQWSQDVLKFSLQLGGTCQCCRAHKDPAQQTQLGMCSSPSLLLPAVGRLLSQVRWKRDKRLLQDGEPDFKWRNNSNQQILQTLKQAPPPCFLPELLKHFGMWKGNSKGCHCKIFQSI